MMCPCYLQVCKDLSRVIGQTTFPVPLSVNLFSYDETLVSWRKSQA